MNSAVRRFLIWAPRILCLAMALFLALFAFDVFEQGKPIWQTGLALLFHLIPSFLVLGVLSLAWRFEWIGGLALLSLAAAYLVIAWGRVHWTAFLFISGPLAITGGLFLTNGLLRTKLRART